MLRRARTLATARTLLTAVAAVAALVLVAGAGLVATAPASAATAPWQPFAKAYSVNANGDIAIVGNTLESCTTGATNPDCTQVRLGTSGSLAASGTSLANNANTSQFVNVAGDPALFNSSSARLTVPTDGSVLFAGLVWSGRTNTTATQTTADPAKRDNVVLKTPDGVSHNLVSTSTGVSNATSGTIPYQGFVDVTSLVSASGTGDYTVGNVQSLSGGGDQYAGWALVVALADPNAPMRNLTVFKGFDTVNSGSNPNVDLTVSGFITPPQGAVRTTLGVVAYEGDNGGNGTGTSTYRGDSLKITSGGVSTPISDALNPANDVFNSTISTRGVDLGQRNPNYRNQLGFDADTFNADGAIPNGGTSATLSLTTGGETYYPGIVTLATDLYDPKLNSTKTAHEVELTGDSSFGPGDAIDYTITAQNDGLDTADDSRIVDAIPTGTTYVPGSLTIDGVPVTDAAGDDAGEFSPATAQGLLTARIGTNASTTQGGSVPTGGVSHTITFRVLVDSGVAPGQTIVNAADALYRGATTGSRASSVSNATADPVVGSATGTGPTAPNRVLQLTPTPGTPSIDIDALGGASDNGGPLTLVGTTAATAGTVTVQGGHLIYTPAPGFAGRDVFTYTVQDADGNRATGVIKVDVINLLPVGVDDAPSVSHSAPTQLNLVGNDTDGNGDTLHVYSATVNGTTIYDGGSATLATGASVSLANGVATYTPRPGGDPAGSTASFTYIVEDARGGRADTPATVTLTAANGAPVAADDSYRVPQNATTPITPLANDTDPDGDALTLQVVTAPSHGTLSVTSGGVTYTPDAGYAGPDSFTYRANDGAANSNIATVSIQVNGAPTPAPDAKSTPGNTATSVNVLSNDTDPNGDTLTVTAVQNPPAGHGTVTFSAGGTVSYTPAPGFVGSDTLSYTVSDGTLTANSTVTFTVQNVAPTAVATTATTGTDQPITLPVQSAVTDPNVTAGFQTLTTTAASADHGATAAIQPDGTVIVTPAPGYSGPVTVTYTVSDGVATVTSTVALTVTNDAPTATPASATIPTNGTALIDALDGDSDPNNDTLTIQSLGTPRDGNGVARGTAVVENGQVRYTAPQDGWFGTVTFGYTIDDGHGNTATATVTVTVLNANPVANADAVTTPSNTAVTVDVLGNDTDANNPTMGQTLSVATATGDHGATVTIVNGKVKVVPAAGYVGDITVDYTVSDGDGGTASGVLTVTVQNAVPVVTPASGTTTGSAPTTVDLLAGATDANGDPLTVTSFTQPVGPDGQVHGTVTVVNGVATVVPDAGFSGVLSFTYQVADGRGGVTTGTASVTVAAAAVVPAATASAGSGTGAETLAFTGADVVPAGLAALVLLLAGVTLVLVRRRRGLSD